MNTATKQPNWIIRFNPTTGIYDVWTDHNKPSMPPLHNANFGSEKHRAIAYCKDTQPDWYIEYSTSSNNLDD